MKILKSLFPFFFNKQALRQQAEDIYWQIVAISRQKELYIQYNIHDTTDGRFDCLILHIFPLLRRLQNIPEHHRLASIIVDVMIYDMERSLRETGVGDPAIARKMRHIGEAYAGRIKAYHEAFALLPDRTFLEDCLFRNIYRSDENRKKNVSILTNYVIQYSQVFDLYMPDHSLKGMFMASESGVCL